MLIQSVQHQVGCKRLNHRLNSLTFVHGSLGVLTLIGGVADTVIWNKISILWGSCPHQIVSVGCLAISPILIASIFFMQPPLLGYLIVGGYGKHIRVMLMIFLFASLISVLASFSLCALSILTLSTISTVFKCQEGPVINLKSAAVATPSSSSVNFVESDIMNTSFMSETRCPIEPGVSDQALIVSVVGLILALFQLLMSVIGTIISLQIKPWKQVEVRVRTSYDRFRSLKLSCGCGGEIAINRHVASATAVNASHAKVNPSFKDLQVQKMGVIDDDNFLNHLESCTPTRFQTPTKGSLKGTM